MLGVLALVVAGLASAHGYTCSICIVPELNYCCSNIYDDTTRCCSAEEFYYKGGFLNQEKLMIAVGVGVAVLLLLLLFICCCCCSCCPCYRRRQGAVYNSVASPCGQVYHHSTAPHFSAQYPPQPPSNPYLVPQASAPPAYSSRPS